MNREPFDPNRMRHSDVPDEWNKVTQRVIACAMEVRSVLPIGLLERLYENAMVYELRQAGLSVARQVPIRIRYKNIELGEQKLDLVVNDLVILELKAVDRIHEAHMTQLLSYLRSADLPLGLLINFHQFKLSEGIRRRVNYGSSRFPKQFRTSPRLSAPSASSAFLP